MKTNQLRIGNYIFVKEDSEVNLRKISGLTSNEVIYSISINGKNKFFANPIENVIPIKLTDESLIKLGFKRFCKDFSFKGIIVHTRKRGFIINKKLPQMEHVHQLQNYVFACRNVEMSYSNELDYNEL